MRFPSDVKDALRNVVLKARELITHKTVSNELYQRINNIMPSVKLHTLKQRVKKILHTQSEQDKCKEVREQIRRYDDILGKSVELTELKKTRDLLFNNLQTHINQRIQRLTQSAQNKSQVSESVSPSTLL
jgi:vacuolar-type H+-ATPase subunit D/Vma8